MWPPLRLLASTAILGVVGLSAPSALALRAFTSKVPNAVRIGCVLCHTDTRAPVTFNSFGEDVRAHLLEGVPHWPALHELDSDGDGQTNGQELGDPCGIWRPGETPGRYTELSLPGDETSTSATPNEPPCVVPDGGTTEPDAATDGGEPADAGEPPADGGCDCRSGTASSASGRVLTLTLFVLLCLRRSGRARANSPSLSRASPPPAPGRWLRATPGAGTGSSGR